MRRREFLGFVSLVGTGGCLRLEAGEPASNTEKPTASETPTEVTRTTTDPTTTRRHTETETQQETETQTETDQEIEDYPVGLSESGVDQILVQNHANSLANTGFTRSWEAEFVTHGNTYTHDVSRVEGGSEITEHQHDITSISTSEGQYWRQPVNGGVTFGYEDSAFNQSWAVRAWLQRELIKVGAWESPSLNEDGSFRISADGFVDGRTIEKARDLGVGRIEQLRSFDAEGRVTADGIITELQTTYQFTNDDGRLKKWRTDYEVTDIGSTSVTEPSWYETAKEKAPTVTASITSDDFIEYRFEEGNQIEAGSRAELRDQDNSWIAGKEIETPIQSDTTLYMWLDGGELKWKQDTHPSGVRPDKLDAPLKFTIGRDGTVEYHPRLEVN